MAATTQHCIGVASALVFLHGGSREHAKVVHRDIKSENILLNHGWKAKLADFGLSLITAITKESDYVIDGVCGTRGYVDPLYEELNFLTVESDIYSFGVVLFEILCGRSTHAIHDEEGCYLPDFIKRKTDEEKLEEVVFEHIRKDIVPESLSTFQNIAYKCLNKKREDRPKTKQVLRQLKRALEFQEKQLHLDKFVDELQNALGNQLAHDIPGKNLEHLKIPLAHIMLATENFSDRCKIRTSTFYTWYKGELQHFDKENPYQVTQQEKIVTVMRLLPRDDDRGEEVFFTEFEVLASVEHRNMVKLYGFCVEGCEMILVIENFSNGYLGDYLGNVNRMRSLTWEKRLKICIHVSQALHYLHNEMGNQQVIINRNIKSSNIALDKNWRAKIVQSGLSVFLPPDQKGEALYLNEVVGSPYYIDPEYEKTGKIKRESDVYSFGVVMLEILCGRLAYDLFSSNEDKSEDLAFVARQCFNLETLENMIDPIIEEEYGVTNVILNKDSLVRFVNISLQCVAETQEERPTMEVVIKQLEKALLLQGKTVAQIDL